MRSGRGQRLPGFRCAAGIAVGMIASAAAVSAWGADLLEVYHRAQGSDPTFEAARYTLEATQQKMPEARAGFLPTVNLTGNDNATKATTSFTGVPLTDRNVRAWTWNVQLTQPLIRLQNLYAYNESELLVEQAQAQYVEAEQELILRVVQAYFDMLTAEEGIGAAEAQLRAMSEQLAVAQHGFEKGAAAITDVHEAKSKADLAHAQLVAAQSDLEAKHSELEKLIGEMPGSLAGLLPASVIPKLEPDDAKSWVDRAKLENPAVRAQQAALDAAEAGISKNRAEHLPTLDLTASYGGNYSSGSIGNPTDFMSRALSRQAGVQLTIPISAGGATAARVDEAIANRNKANAQLEEARRKSAADAKQAYAAIKSGLSQIEALESAVESGQSSVAGNRKGYALGIRINSDVLGAEQQLYSSRRDLAKARYDTLLQGFKLKAAAGVLNEDDLVAVNAMLGEQQVGLQSAVEEK